MLREFNKLGLVYNGIFIQNKLNLFPGCGQNFIKNYELNGMELSINKNLLII